MKRFIICILLVVGLIWVGDWTFDRLTEVKDHVLAEIDGISQLVERGEMQDVNAFLPVSGVSRKTPSISRERTFGMRIEGEGNAEFSGIVINYKMMGGVR